MKYLAKFRADTSRNEEGYSTEDSIDVFSWYTRACKVCDYLSVNYKPRAELYDNDGVLISFYIGGN